MLATLYRNHVLANLTFLLVLIIGSLTYFSLPREQDPTVDFNWIEVTTIFPGAAATDVEARVTDVLERAIRQIDDVKFVSSTSRTGLSGIVIRFRDNLTPERFAKRVSDLRREIQNKEEELPDAAEDPQIVEITTANAFPSAMVVVTGAAWDENLRQQAKLIKQDLERLPGVDRVITNGLEDPELQVRFKPAALEAVGLAPSSVADAVRGYYRDIAAGSVQLGQQQWLVRVQGSNPDPTHLARLPIPSASGEVQLGEVAEIVRAREEPNYLVSYNDRPAVLISVNKQADRNTLRLVDAVKQYIAERNQLTAQTGVELTLADDQTPVTRHALQVMQNNAALGLLLVLAVAWLFLGWRIAILTAIGIPFILAGTFWLLELYGATLNTMVLLGVVISLGMLVDDAVVVVEAIYFRLQRGAAGLPAILDSLREVVAPVTTAVLTTMAAFLPLLLLPGILGQFMSVVPMVVTTALALSLVEAYWMLPTHILGAGVRFRSDDRGQQRRERLLHRLRVRYTRWLLKVMRRPRLTLIGVILLFALAVSSVLGGLVKLDFFASDTVRLFYVNVQMPAGTPLTGTMTKVKAIEAKVKAAVRPGEARAIVSLAGQLFTPTARLQGPQYGQIMVSLQPRSEALRTVEAMIAAMRPSVQATPGPEDISFQRLSGGPPTPKPISIKVRGDTLPEIRAAVADLRRILERTPGVKDITDNDLPGELEWVLRVDGDAIRQAGLTPEVVSRNVSLLVDGEIVASMQDRGEELEVRVVNADNDSGQRITDILDIQLPLGATDGTKAVLLQQLVNAERQRALSNIKHYDFRRSITLEADLDTNVTDTVTANRQIVTKWEAIAANHPSIALDFSGELEDIQEGLDNLARLFLLGLLLIYLILGTQFRSYLQPFLILATLPMAFTGVVAGLLLTGNPLSLFTLYGVIALGGIAVNAAIVLIDAANRRRAQGMSVLHATVYAARRRVVPILITALTTIAGLFSLAAGLGGKSLVWGPVATAIVWGLTVSTLLTLFVIPLLYRLAMGRHKPPPVS